MLAWQVNYLGTVGVTKALLPLLKASALAGQGARVINLTSMAGLGPGTPNVSTAGTVAKAHRPQVCLARIAWIVLGPLLRAPDCVKSVGPFIRHQAPR
jgi:NAD(P)-dependent dehydrogenase (short-subunit alcohol dehydrogenase family)